MSFTGQTTSNHSGLSVSAIVGVAFGVVVVAAIVAGVVVVFVFTRRRRRRR